MDNFPNSMFSPLSHRFVGSRKPFYREHSRTMAFLKKWQRKAARPKKNGRKIPKFDDRTTPEARPPKLKESMPKADRSLAHKLPAVLSPTASPNVFIAKIAAQSANQNLFNGFVQSNFAIPSFFQKASFEYFPPAHFNHELPTGQTPEVAFLGRSNVGKSNLINALMRRPLAKVSKQPGRTQNVFYFGLVQDTNAIGYLIDLPGYGFAVGPDKAVDSWQKITQDFLLQRRDSNNLRRLFLLVDARHGATNMDRTVMGWMEEAEIPFTIVLTKSDAIRLPELVKQVNIVCLRYHHQSLSAEAVMSPIVHVTSAKNGNGIAELLSAIETEFSSKPESFRW